MATQYIITNEPGEIDFEGHGSPQSRAVQNAKNLLMTRMGEIPFDRQRGFDGELYDRPMVDLQRFLMEELDRVMLWEPYVEVVQARILQGEDGRTTLEVVISVADDAE